MSERTPLLGNNNNNNNSNVVDNLTKFYTSLSQFERSIKDIGTTRDNVSFRGQLHRRKVELNENFKYINGQIKTIGSSQLPKIQQEKIIKQFKDAATLFESLMSNCNQKESNYQPLPDPQLDQQIQFNNQHQPEQQNYNNNGQQQKYDTLGGRQVDQDEIYNQIVEERNKQTRELLADIQNIQGAMSDLSMLVGEQTVMLEKADDNVEQADINVEESVVNLEKAMEYKSSSRKKVFILVICLLITLGAVAVFLGIWFGVVKK
eukprot:gene10354-12716_t